MELPEQWLWDIIDEFIYQYQVFCTWRSKLKNKTDDELLTLAEGGPVRVRFIMKAPNIELNLLGLEFVQRPQCLVLLDAEVQNQ